eukprot:6092764-Lingulodinium_polyedra.AAC.1
MLAVVDGHEPVVKHEALKAGVGSAGVDEWVEGPRNRAGVRVDHGHRRCGAEKGGGASGRVDVAPERGGGLLVANTANWGVGSSQIR